ncbi:MAG TPA: extracellular solute-binding protein [Propionibacteriaceae bacterium]|nr:extracellular solute-binding protein [Propionibacteriaceae bacterium]HQE30436.1 extracellular solute-binding protein [Propionibacteriaceae bacterium]
MTSTFNRRAMIGLGAGGLALAAGCSGSATKAPSAGTSGAASASAAPSSAGPVSGTLRVSWYGGQPVHDAMKTSMEAFKTANSGVTISGAGVGFGDYWDKLATETAGGTMPDVFRMSMTYFSDYSARGALMDLTPQVDKTIMTNTLDADVKGSGLVNNKMFGIGQSSITPAVFGNKTMLASVGGAIPADWTWDSFKTWTTDFAKNAGPGKFGSTDLAGNWQMFDVYARQMVGNQFDDAGKLKVTKEVVESWFSFWEGLRKANVVPPASLTAESTTYELNPMTKGLSPITYGWVQQVTFFASVMKDPLLVGPLPQKTKGDLSGQFVKALDFWCVSSKTKSPEAAATFVDFLINNEAATKPIGLLLGVPPTKAARALLSSGNDATKSAVAFVEQTAGKAGKAPGPWPRGYSEVMSSFTRASESVAFGKANAGAAATAFLTEATAALNK